MAEPETRAVRQQRAWQLGGTGWSVIDDPLANPGTTAESYPDALRRAGYARQPSIRLEGGGQWTSDYYVEVYPGREFDRFLVCLNTRGQRHNIAVEGFGQLVTLLNQLIPIVKMGAETQEKERRIRRQGEPSEGLP
jgi:hypothetical protein